MNEFQQYDLTKNGQFEASFSNKKLAVFTAGQRDIVTKGWAVNGEPITRTELLQALETYGTPEATSRVAA